MPDETPHQKRQVAHKLMIKDILNAHYVKEEGWNPNYLVLEDKRQVSRVNLLGTIIDKDVNVKSNYQSLIVDDGYGNVSLRNFENKNAFDDVNIGDSILIIGRPREFGHEKYIVPEIIKKIENKEWIELRKLELGKNVEVPKEEVEVKKIQEEVVDDGNDVFCIVKNLDKGDGADFNDVVGKLNKENSEGIINNMIKIGELFEIRPGKIKVLE